MLPALLLALVPLAALQPLTVRPVVSPATFASGAQQEGWKRPPQEVVDLVTAAPTPSVDVAPDGGHLLIVERDALPPLSELARPWLPLAGMRVDPSTNGTYRTYTATGLVVRPLPSAARGAEAREGEAGGAGERENAGGERGDAGGDWRVPVPEGARVGDVSWAHDGRRFAYTLVVDGAMQLWIANVERRATAMVVARLNGVFDAFGWMPDGERVLALVVPDGRGAVPEEPAVPKGPAVQETSGSTTPVRTYQDLLEDAHDEALLRHYGTSQPVVVDEAGLAVRLGRPGLYLDVVPSPSGERFLVRRLEEPFSYVLPYWRFGRSIEVWNGAGEREHVVVRVPLVEDVPIEGVRTGPRAVSWHPVMGATLTWVEALDGGDPEVEAELRDRWMRWNVEQPGEPVRLCTLEERALGGLTWLGDGRFFFAADYDRDRRWLRTFLVDADDSERRLVVEDRNRRDAYGDPGNVVTAPNRWGRRVAVQDGTWVFLRGAGAAPEGARPFLDRMELATGATERIWRCAEGSYETVVDLLARGSEGVRFVTRFEEPETPPNWRVLRASTESVEPEVVAALTDFPDPTPELRGIEKRLVRYGRGDGVELSATLYLPAGYEEGTRLPLVVWAYPMEFSDPATASQVRGTPHRFTRMGGISHLFFLTQGYAVLDGAAMPVVGDPKTVNDTFREQIVAAARAAIDHAVELGVSDGTRAGVGGHSYGAFMTANLLAHSDLFRAGIARSGAYNRTLTPFGFQAERRTLWEAPEIYFAISPFMHAHEIEEPLLLLHGAADSNPGTFPIQSERLFHAIKGHGGTARLVMLPHEGHGYQARESVLHTLAEMFAWFDEHVKGASVSEAGWRAEPVGAEPADTEPAEPERR